MTNYNGLKLAGLKDPFGNIWWIYERWEHKTYENKSETDWHYKKPSTIYTSLMNAMKSLKYPK